MNNKGFTLIELLAVIVILSVISLTAVMGISASLERRDKKEQDEQEEIAKNAAKLYFSLNGGSAVSINILIDNEYLKKDKVDKLDRDNGCIKIVNNDYEYQDDCSN